ncbi:Importin alpha [Entamoeba marina]
MKLHQKRDFKSIVDSHSSHSSSLRSRRREDVLDQHRRFPPPLTPELEENSVPIPENYVNRIEKLKTMLQSTDINIVSDAVVELRLYTMGEGYVPLEEIIQANIINLLLNLLTSSYINEEIQYEILWFYTNLATLDTGTVAILIRYHIMDVVGRLGCVSTGRVAIQAAWLMGNVAAEGQKFRSIVLDAGFFNILERAFQSGPDVSPYFVVDTVIKFIPVIESILVGGGIEEIRDAAMCILYLSHNDSSIQQLMRTTVYYRVFMLCGSENGIIQNTSLRTISLLSSKSDQNISILFDKSGVIPYLASVFTQTKNQLVKRQIGLIFSNLVIASTDFIDHLISLDFYTVAVKLFYLIFNSLTSDYDPVIENLLQQESFVTCFKYLPRDDADFLILALNAVLDILRWNPEIIDLKDKFVEIKFDKFLDELVSSENTTLSDFAATLLSFHFDGVDDLV